MTTIVIQLTEEDELRWDDGTAHPEYCLDQFNLVGRVSCNVAQTVMLREQACKVWFDRVHAAVGGCWNACCWIGNFWTRRWGCQLQQQGFKNALRKLLDQLCTTMSHTPSAVQRLANSWKCTV